VKRTLLPLLLLGLLLIPSRPASASGFWDWMQEWSGPGAFGGLQPMLMVNLCPREYYERDVGEAPSCIFVDMRRLRAEQSDNFPVRVTVRMFDVGVTTKMRISKLRQSLEIGYGFGFLSAEAAQVGSLGGKTMNKITITAPRASLKPLLAIAELADVEGLNGRSFKRRLLSVPKVHLGATIVLGTMDSPQLGVPLNVNDFSNSNEIVLSRGIMLDFGELLPGLSNRLLSW
jgi:hypothetical protein